MAKAASDGTYGDTARGGVIFPNDNERAENEKNPIVQQRIGAKKAITLHPNSEPKKLADEMSNFLLTEKIKDSKRPILVFVRKVEDVEKIVAKLDKADQEVQQLTGTLRGKERDELIGDSIFIRFLPDATSKDETVYLVCTSAGEVGVNISADHLICDLSTFESMAQRFGRVNRFGLHLDTEIHIFHPTEFDEKDDYDSRLQKTLTLMERLNGDGSPKALGQFNLDERKAAFAPTPTILPVTDILFDAWALTTIRGKLPGRPPVEAYLHGVSEWEPPETHVAWRKEVGLITGTQRQVYDPEELLEEYPLKAHELLRDRSDRVLKHVVELAARRPADQVWLVGDDGNVEVLKLEELADNPRKDRINYKTILLSPDTGGLENGLLNGDSMDADDVADQWFLDVDRKEPRRIRLWEDDEEPVDFAKKFRLIREIVFRDDEDEEAEPMIWRWYVRPASADDDGSKTAKNPITWLHHTNDVENGAKRLADTLLKNQPDLHKALALAARFHDLGKKRIAWQRSIGNPTPEDWHAKSGKDPITGKMWRPLELTPYRHEFGSLIDLEKEEEFKNLQSEDQKELIRHLIAVHHGYGRPHFPRDLAFDPERPQTAAEQIASDAPQRFACLQRKYGRWGLAYLESLLRAVDWAASAYPSKGEKS